MDRPLNKLKRRAYGNNEFHLLVLEFLECEVGKLEFDHKESLPQVLCKLKIDDVGVLGLRLVLYGESHRFLV